MARDPHLSLFCLELRPVSLPCRNSVQWSLLCLLDSPGADFLCQLAQAHAQAPALPLHFHTGAGVGKREAEEAFHFEMAPESVSGVL